MAEGNQSLSCPRASNSPSTRLSNASPTLGWVQEAEEKPGAREAMGLLRVYGRPFPSLILGPICKPEGAVTRILTVPVGLGSTPNSAPQRLCTLSLCLPPRARL